MTEKIAVKILSESDYDKYIDFLDSKGYTWFRGKKSLKEHNNYRLAMYIGVDDEGASWDFDRKAFDGFRFLRLEDAINELQTPEEQNTSPSPDVFVRGEEVEVSDDKDARQKAEYITTYEGLKYPYIAVVDGYIASYSYRHIRKLPQVQEAGPKKFTEKDVDDFVKVYSPSQRSIVTAAGIKDFLKSKNLLEFGKE